MGTKQSKHLKQKSLSSMHSKTTFQVNPTKHSSIQTTNGREGATITERPEQVKSRSTDSITAHGREYHTRSNYCLPQDDDEKDRLNSQHFIVKALFDSQNILPEIRKGLPEDAHILDSGCGSGAWLMEVATDNPLYTLVGVDISEMIPSIIRPANTRFDFCDILQGLPYKAETFDFVFMRFMMTVLEPEAWPNAIADVFRVLKHGGYVQHAEYDISYEVARKTAEPGDSVERQHSKKEFNAKIDIANNFNAKFRKLLEKSRVDYQIGLRLKSLLENQNFEVIGPIERHVNFGDTSNPLVKEMVVNWRNIMLSLRLLLDEKNENHFAEVEEYIDAIQAVGWRVKVLAYSGRKPTKK